MSMVVIEWLNKNGLTLDDFPPSVAAQIRANVEAEDLEVKA